MRFYNKIKKKLKIKEPKKTNGIGTSLFFGINIEMEKILRECFESEENLKNAGIIGFVDNVISYNMWGGVPKYLPKEINNISYDRIIIGDDKNYNRLRDELVYGFGISKDKIVKLNYLLYLRVIQKYDSESDVAIKKTIEKIRGLTYFDYWCGYCSRPSKLYEVFWDKEFTMPYTIFEGKRMYFPREKSFIVEKEKQYVRGLEFEQQYGSPHAYFTDEHNIKKNDVLVDAGVCEGNFALKHIDKIAKVYLIECDPVWEYPLKLTFSPYKDKVIFCNKFLGDKDDENTITLDTLTNGEKIDFIKMDIEGAEVSALRGGKRVLEENNVRCSICSYHQHGDEEAIKEILNHYGYKTQVSDGHMIFHADKDRFKYSELRKGIVYGWK